MAFQVFPICVYLGKELMAGCFYLPYSLRFEIFSKFSQCYIIAGLRYGFSKQGWVYILVTNVQGMESVPSTSQKEENK